MVRVEWLCTYRSARHNGYGRLAALRKFAREVIMGALLESGLHPKYDRRGHAR